MSLLINIEAHSEYQVQEIAYDGTEYYTQSLSMSENLTHLASKVDFGKIENKPSTPSEFSDEKAKKLIQESLWPWDSVRTQLKSIFTEICVLIDILNVIKCKQYLAMDAITNEPFENKQYITLLQKKKAFSSAASILIRGAEQLQDLQHEPTISQLDYHFELLLMRQSWKLKKVGNSILGDISYCSAGSSYRSSGVFEVTKNETQQNPSLTALPLNSVLKVILPKELEGIGVIQVGIQNDTDIIASSEMPIPNHISIEDHWQAKLEAASNVLFCKELFSQLASEAVQMQSSIPNLVSDNKITISIFPGVKLNIGFYHTTMQEGVMNSQLNPNNNGLMPVLEHSLHQLLREIHHKAIHIPMPHPTTSSFYINKKRRLAGPEALDLDTIQHCTKYETMLQQIIKQARHGFLRLRTMHVIDKFASENKDPLIIAHWLCLNSPTLSSVRINIVTSGYEALCRTSFVIHVEEKSLRVICRDGGVMTLSYEAQELQSLLMCQVSQHQIIAAQALAKLMRWKVLSFGINTGMGSLESTGNASSLLMTSSKGDKTISIRSSPKSGINVSLSYYSDTSKYYPSTLVKDQKWQNLSENFREVALDKMEGGNFLRKLEHLMVCLTSL